jgi:NADPH:quinone reductase-like Zn-dependent oxidoreductase
MRAVWLEEHGGLEVLKVADRPEPKPGPGEALVEVKACGLNHLDIWVRKGGRRFFPLPLIMGSDAAGVVLEAPAGSGLEPGDEVVVYPCEGCGVCTHCEVGRVPLCEQFLIYGAGKNGGMAERAVFPIENCLRRPPSLTVENAAAVAINYITAWHMLVTRARIQPGEKVVIQAAGSGVSTAALQIARFLGAEILATSSSARKLEHARSCGADLTVNYRSDDVADHVLDWTGGRGADVILDHVGAPNWNTNLQALAKGGRLVFCGNTGGPEVNLNLSMVYFKGQSILGSTMGTRDEFRKVLGLMGRGVLRPIVDKVFPMDEIAAAHQYLEGQEQIGKVVVRVS